MMKRMGRRRRSKQILDVLQKKREVTGNRKRKH
jgi:hypothetical protein